MASKGFTLVEMSIVLVIIGILMAFAIKGKSLIETSRLYKEISIMRETQNIFMGYYGMTGKYPKTIKGSNSSPKRQYACFDMADVLKTAGLESQVLESGIWPAHYGVCNFIIQSAADVTLGAAYYDTYLDVNALTHRGILAVMPKAGLEDLNVDTPQIVNISDYCKIEAIIDDKNPRDGKMRFVNQAKTQSPTCDDLDSKISLRFAVEF